MPVFSQVLIDHTGVLEDVCAPHPVLEKEDSNILNLKLWLREFKDLWKTLPFNFAHYFLSILLYWIWDLFSSKCCCHILHICRVCVQTPEYQNAILGSGFCPCQGKGSKKHKVVFPGDMHKEPKRAPRSKAPASFPAGITFSLYKVKGLSPSTKPDFQFQELTMEGKKRNERGENILKCLMCFLQQSLFLLHLLTSITLPKQGDYRCLVLPLVSHNKVCCTWSMCQKHTLVQTVTEVNLSSHLFCCWITNQ